MRVLEEERLKSGPCIVWEWLLSVGQGKEQGFYVRQSLV